MVVVAAPALALQGALLSAPQAELAEARAAHLAAELPARTRDTLTAATGAAWMLAFETSRRPSLDDVQQILCIDEPHARHRAAQLAYSWCRPEISRRLRAADPSVLAAAARMLAA